MNFLEYIFTLSLHSLSLPENILRDQIDQKKMQTLAAAVAGAATGVAVAGAAAVAASAADESSEDKSNCGIEIDVGAAVELIVRRSQIFDSYHQVSVVLEHQTSHKAFELQHDKIENLSTTVSTMSTGSHNHAVALANLEKLVKQILTNQAKARKTLWFGYFISHEKIEYTLSTSYRVAFDEIAADRGQDSIGKMSTGIALVLALVGFFVASFTLLCWLAEKKRSTVAVAGATGVAAAAAVAATTVADQSEDEPEFRIEIDAGAIVEAVAGCFG
nr:uncharacterized protein LOC109160849 [Ipomoea batatas]